MVDALFAHTDVHRIAASIDPANVASMRVLEHLGFRDEGTSRRAERVRGEWLDEMRFALLRDDRVVPPPRAERFVLPREAAFAGTAAAGAPPQRRRARALPLPLRRCARRSRLA